MSPICVQKKIQYLSFKCLTYVQYIYTLGSISVSAVHTSMQAVCTSLHHCSCSLFSNTCTFLILLVQALHIYLLSGHRYCLVWAT